MKMGLGVFLDPALVSLVRVEIVEDDAPDPTTPARRSPALRRRPRRDGLGWSAQEAEVRRHYYRHVTKHMIELRKNAR